MKGHATEVLKGERFEFGANWKHFLSVLNDERIDEAKSSLCRMLHLNNLSGKTFLDIGCGSGLFSLAARMLGAKVHSFDYDPQSVACTNELKERYFPNDASWIIEQGSALDVTYLAALGQYDVVYSWGVLHHTGSMWKALENIVPLVKRDGQLYIAIYNKQQFMSAYWSFVKNIYNQLWPVFRHVLITSFYLFFICELFIADLVRRRNPSLRYRGKGRRGMSIYYDVIDWIGGWPFEVAAPEEVFRFFREKGFILTELITCGGKHGCNEFVFNKVS